MTKLTQSQCDLLRNAAAADDGAIDAPDDAKALRPLIKQGLFIALPQAGGPSRLIITDAGREAVGATKAPLAETVEPTAPPASESDPPPTSAPAKKPTKIDALLVLLRQPEGARIEELIAATGWQAHSVRGAMSGAIKKGLGLAVSSEKIDGARVYRIVESGA